MKTSTILRLRGLSKTFGGTRVLESVDLDLFPGQVHALLGQNGSGKSTLIKILSGYHLPDSGSTAEMNGHPVDFPLPRTAGEGTGIAFVHQDLALIDSADVADNIRVGRFETAPGWRISRKRERALTTRALSRFDLDLVPATPVADLTDIDRASVAIVRALDQIAGDSNAVLVLDEPTAYLPRDVIGQLFTTIRRVADEGVAVLIVTHRLDEVFAIADRVAVLRNGRLVADGPTSSFTEEELIDRIVGSTVETVARPAEQVHVREVVLEVRDLASELLRGVSFSLRQGEVLGLTGLRGMGWEEVPYALFGATGAQGSAVVEGITVELPSLTPRRARALRLGLIPANRLRDAVVTEASVMENVTLSTLRRHWRGGLLRLADERARAAGLVRKFDVRPADPSAAMGALSGGNQQKAVIAKWLEAQPAVLLVHEPVQGVDIGSRQQIFQTIRDASETGTSFVVSSAEYGDLATICHRVLVFRDGRVTKVLKGAEVTEGKIAQESLR